MRSARLFITIFIALFLFTPTVVLAQDSTPAAVEPERPPMEQGVVYGQDDPTRQLMHVYRQAPRDDPRPAIVVIHGGGFVYGDPSEFQRYAEVFVEKDFVTFLIGYRLFNQASGENAFPTALDDVQLAVRWIRAHAEEFNVDPDRIGAVGASTGGQLAGLLGTMETRDPAAPLAEYSSRVNAVASFSGDLDQTVPLSESWAPLYAEIIGGTLAEHPELYEAASPVTYVDADTAPFLITHGTNDVDSPPEQSLNMVAALTEAGIEFVYAEFPGKDHIGAIFFQPVWQLAATFMDYQLRPDR
jgi:acetyl esterase/lipase